MRSATQDAEAPIERALAWLKSRHPPGHWDDTRADPLVVLALLECNEHPDSPMIREGVSSLLFRQGEDGSWSEEVWDTTFAVRSLIRAGIDSESEQVKKAIRWLLNLQDKRTGSWHGEIWETSFSLLCLSDTKHSRKLPQVEYAAKWLEVSQLPDGSWLHAPHLTAVSLLALSNLEDPNRRLVKKASDWLLNYGAKEVWTQESYANAYAILALTKAGLTTDEPAIQKGLDWLARNQTIIPRRNLGYWSDEEDTCLSIIAICSALRLRFSERKVIMIPQTASCEIIAAESQLIWNLSTPSNRKVQPTPLPLDTSVVTEIVNDLSRLGGGAYRSLRSQKSAPNLRMQIDQLKRMGSSIWDLLIPKEFQETIGQERTDHVSFELNDPTLLQIPWELAYDGDNFLSLKFAVGREIIRRSLPNFAVSERRKKTKPRFLLVGNSTSDLEGSELEVIKIAEKLKAEDVADCVLLEETSLGNTRTNFLRELAHGNYDIVHYAGHAIVDSSNPEKSYLPFSDEAGDIIRLYASQITNAMTINRTPRVVFLNACDSAKQDKTRYLEDANGLASAFISNGIPLFIGPMWPVHDLDAAQFATRFYSNTILGFTVGESLRIARNEASIDKNSKSPSWASFILYGSPSSIIFN